ncbi:MAG: HAMP domain-containing sensor histidine kinase [Patescibacteria group bacterium]|nr:HAMP domain-containing sensor histidine kinase [Patescibacteria group bacterium]
MEEELKQLKTENEILKRKNAAKFDLISISSHQLRTSLSALKWTIKMFLDKDLGKISKEQEIFLSKSYENLEKMNNLVNDTLTLNNTENAKELFKKKQTNIVELIKDTMFEFFGEAKKKNISLKIGEVDKKIPEIKCNEKMIRVVLQNLIGNALKYNNPKGEITISIKNIDNGIEIFVKDDGIGIGKEERDNIFQRFYRTESAKKKEPVGSGLGLYTVKKIIEDHKGMISFKSEKNKGTTFFVILPLT